MNLFLVALTCLMLLAAIGIWVTSSIWYRMLFCPWCWQDCHLRRWYPEHWSSTICPFHVRKVLADQTARRHRRALLSKEVS